MTSAFSSSEAAAIERQVDLADSSQPECVDIQLEDFWNDAQLAECVGWIREHGFQKVCSRLMVVYEFMKFALPPGMPSISGCDAAVQYGHCRAAAAVLAVRYSHFGRHILRELLRG